MKKIRRCIVGAVRVVLGFGMRFRWGRYFLQEVVECGMGVVQNVSYREFTFQFSVPNALNYYRVETFSSKEPETLEWIDSINHGSVFWDVGANIGLYSIYAAKTKGCRVYAFEPSVFNLELLARNINLNELQKYVTTIPIALSDHVGISAFNMTTTEWGGALSTFGQDFDQNGKILEKKFEYQTLGMSMDAIVESFGLPTPEFIKIDVDGIEHFILRGGEVILRRVQSVLIEINDSFADQAEEAVRHLTNAGLCLYRKCDIGVPGQYNQWWIRRC